MGKAWIQSLDGRGLYRLAASGWSGLALLFAGLAAASPEASLAHAGWCLNGATAAGYGGLLVMGHCPWCYAAAGAAGLALALLAGAQREA
jgi:hypothetical protein